MPRKRKTKRALAKARARSRTKGQGPEAALPKLCGADVELGNFVLGLDRPDGSGAEAARALLAAVPGVADRWSVAQGYGSGLVPSGSGGQVLQVPIASAVVPAFNPQDWGRKYLRENGGCVYIDLNHLELCVPEALSAWDHVACWRAMLNVARAAQRVANERLPDGLSIKVLINNSDGRGNSYGSHINVMVTRAAWERLFQRRLQFGLFLATHQISSIIFTGQGKVGSENGRPPVDFQLAQRADFFETSSGIQTTYQRPVLNTRDEALVGPGRRQPHDPARVHVIFYDSNLCEGANLLKLGSLQIVLAMLEAGEVDLRVILDDPLAAVREISHDPTLAARVETLSGAWLNAVEIQSSILERAEQFVAAGRCEGIVPRAGEIVALWRDTLERLETGDFGTLARRLDWVLKLSMLDTARRDYGLAGWDAPELKHLDKVYSSLDPGDGLFWACEAAGMVDRVVPPERIAHFGQAAPEDTRAWTRSQLLRRLAPAEIEEIDWDLLRFRRAGSARRVTLAMADPLGLTRSEVEPLLTRHTGAEELLCALGAEAEELVGYLPVPVPSPPQDAGPSPSEPRTSHGGDGCGAPDEQRLQPSSGGNGNGRAH